LNTKGLDLLLEPWQFVPNPFSEVRLVMKNLFRFAFLAAFSLALTTASAQAQTDVALSIYGAFNGSTNGNGVQQSPSNQAGGMLELRHISNPLMGYDVSYSFNRANQTYVGISDDSCLGGSCTPASVSADAHELAGNYVLSVKIANLRPFAQAGGGLLFNQPAGSQSNTQSATKPVFVYGAGLDWGLLPHLGLRFQYRGNLYKAPDLTKLYTSTGAFTHSSEPMIGAYLRF
jgi:opacity protein-like surface antigen